MAVVEPTLSVIFAVVRLAGSSVLSVTTVTPVKLSGDTLIAASVGATDTNLGAGQAAFAAAVVAPVC